MKLYFLSMLLSAVVASAYTLADAEKAYVTKDWATAKAAYSEVCPKLSGNEQVSCVYWHSLALSQTGKAADFKAAGKKLDSLISKVSPMDSLYSDLVMTRAQFEIYLKKYVKARESLKHAVESSRNPQSPVFVQVCSMLQKVDNSKEAAELCNAIKDGSLIAVDSATADTTKKIVADSVDAFGAEKTVSKPETDSVENSVASSAKVQVEVPAKQKIDSVEKAAPMEMFALQVGVFGKKENADMLVTALKSRGVETVVVERVSADGVVYLVHSVAFETRAAALDYAEKNIKPLNMDFFVVKK